MAKKTEPESIETVQTAPYTPVKKGTTFTIPSPAVGYMEVTVEGLSDLIIHAWSEKAKSQIRDKQGQKAKEAKGARDPEAEYQAAKYIDPQGRDCLLAAAIKKAVVNAARNVDNMKMTELRQSIFVLGERLPFDYEEVYMREDMVVIGQGKTADLRYRPAYRNWRCTFTVEWDDKKLSAEQVLHLLNTAGFSVGLHDWRPERSGEFGRFRVVHAVAVESPVKAFKPKAKHQAA